MQRKNTQKRRKIELTPPQMKALAAILAGNSITRAAEIAEVDRSTVHRWLRVDWNFKAALNQERRLFSDAIEAQLLRIAQNAAKAVSEAIDGGDTQAALTVLKGLGLLSKNAINTGNENPDVLREESEIIENEAASERRIRASLLF